MAYKLPCVALPTVFVLGCCWCWGVGNLPMHWDPFHKKPFLSARHQDNIFGITFVATTMHVTSFRQLSLTWPVWGQHGKNPRRRQPFNLCMSEIIIAKMTGNGIRSPLLRSLVWIQARSRMTQGSQYFRTAQPPWGSRTHFHLCRFKAPLQLNFKSHTCTTLWC